MPQWLADIDTGATLTVAAALVALAVLTRKAWPTIRGIVHIVDLLTGLQATLDTIKERQSENTTAIDSIHHETHRNDGSSIKDSQLRSEATLGRVERRMDEMTARTAELDEKVSQAAGWIATHEEHSAAVEERLARIEQLIDPDA